MQRKNKRKARKSYTNRQSDTNAIKRLGRFVVFLSFSFCAFTTSIRIWTESTFFPGGGGEGKSCTATTLLSRISLVTAGKRKVEWHVGFEELKVSSFSGGVLSCLELVDGGNSFFCFPFFRRTNSFQDRVLRWNILIVRGFAL